MFLAEAYDLERTRADLADPAKASWLVEAGRRGHRLRPRRPLRPAPRRRSTPGLRRAQAHLLPQGPPGRRPGQACCSPRSWTGCRSAGPRDVWIGVWSENHGALRFYGRHGFEKAGEYGFRVGTTVDREFILRRSGESFSNQTPRKRYSLDTISPSSQAARPFHCLDLTSSRLGAAAAIWDLSRRGLST